MTALVSQLFIVTSPLVTARATEDQLVTVKRQMGDYTSFSVLFNILQNVLSKRIAC